MTAGSSFRPLRVEQALRLLPEVDALAPLRAHLLATSRPTGTRTSGEHHRTVGKRQLDPADLRERIPQAIARVTEHLAALYEAAVDALESEQRGDLSGAVRALLRGGEREQQVGRYSQAHQWYDHALSIGEQLRDRRPEIAALRQVGHLETTRGHLEEGARAYQRGLALAEAERDPEGAALACLGLGDVALAHAQWLGAESWYLKGLRYVEGDRLRIGELTLSLGEVARRREQFDLARDRLREAREIFESLNDLPGAVRVLNAQGLLAAAIGQTDEALTHYRQALGVLHQSGERPGLEMAVRLSLCELYIAMGRFPNAEDEARRTEELAIANNFTRQLARLYVIMGKLRGRQKDEDGFVFFEKAIELCGGPEPAPRLEADVCLEYGRFRRTLGDYEEARGYFERAREILELLGDTSGVERVESEVAELPPS